MRQHECEGIRIYCHYSLTEISSLTPSAKYECLSRMFQTCALQSPLISVRSELTYNLITVPPTPVADLGDISVFVKNREVYC